MSHFIPVPKFNLGTCCVTAEAFSALAGRRINPSQFFDAHQCTAPLNGTTRGNGLADVTGLDCSPQILSTFYVRASIDNHYPPIELCVETSADRKTTVLKLKNETI